MDIETQIKYNVDVAQVIEQEMVLVMNLFDVSSSYDVKSIAANLISILTELSQTEDVEKSKSTIIGTKAYSNTIKLVNLVYDRLHNKGYPLILKKPTYQTHGSEFEKSMEESRGMDLFYKYLTPGLLKAIHFKTQKSST